MSIEESYICSGAVLKCSCGDCMSSLKILPDKRIFISNQPMANVCDHNSLVNIMPFGRCHTTKFPPTGVATTSNHGKLTPMPCVPKTPFVWLESSRDVLVAGNYAILNTSYLKCVYGGIISIVKDGQQPRTSIVSTNSLLEPKNEVLEVVRPVDKLLKIELNISNKIADTKEIPLNDPSSITDELNEALLKVSKELSSLQPIQSGQIDSDRSITEPEILLRGSVSQDIIVKAPKWEDTIQRLLNNISVFLQTHFVQKSLLTISITAEITNRRYLGVGFDIKLKFGINSNNQKYWGFELVHKAWHVGAKPINITASANLALNCKDPEYYDYWDATSFGSLELEIKDLFSVDLSDNFIIGYGNQNPILTIKINTSKGVLIFTLDFNSKQWYLPTNVGIEKSTNILTISNSNKLTMSGNFGAIYSNTWLIE